jgi:methionine-gamma-lyase
MARKKTIRGFETECVHGGEEGIFRYSPASTPIYQTSTFFFDGPEEAAAVHDGEKEGFLYTRTGNPTVKAFEDKMALLEVGESAVAFSSGMGAVSAVFLQVLRPGDEVVSSSRIYGGTRSFYENVLNRMGCPVRYFEPGDEERKIGSLITKKTKIIFFETPSNPELCIVDIGRIAALARKRGVFTAADNTFATPWLQRPLKGGIDCVVHSATKYIGGHGDAIGGVVVGSERFISELRKKMLLNLGACLSPFNAWLFLRGLKTLPLRMDRHCRTASEIARFLIGHPKVKTVLYPGLETHRDYETAKAQMKDFGGMVSIRLKDRENCLRFLRRLKICRIGVSLGDAATLVLHPASLFHRNLSDAACRRAGTDPLLIRISAGLENAQDLIEDMKTALR